MLFLFYKSKEIRRLSFYLNSDTLFETVSALQDAGFAKAYSNGDYYIDVDEYRTSNLELLEFGAEAAAKYLTKELGQNFFVKTRLD